MLCRDAPVLLPSPHVGNLREFRRPPGQASIPGSPDEIRSSSFAKTAKSSTCEAMVPDGKQRKRTRRKTVLGFVSAWSRLPRESRTANDRTTMRQATATGWNNQTAGLWTKPSFFCAHPKRRQHRVGQRFHPTDGQREQKIRHRCSSNSTRRYALFEAVAISSTPFPAISTTS